MDLPKPVVRVCEISGLEFEVSPREAELLQQRQLPLPRLSPLERQRRRLSFRNQRHLHRRKCDATGKSLISMYSPEFRGSVVAQDYWWSDAWDPLEFGREFDFTRPFFEQFHELFLAVPQPATMVNHSENCDYNAYCARSKNCYMSQSVAECENVYYTFGPTHSRDCLDCHNISDHCELCYEVMFGSNCYNVRFSYNVASCRDSSFLFNCKNCSNCFFCSNLRNADYCFWNQKLSPAAYRKQVAEYENLSYQDQLQLTQKFAEFQREQPSPAVWGTANEAASGNQIFNSKQVLAGYDTHDCEDSTHVIRCYKVRSSSDVSFVFIGEQLHEVISVLNSSQSRFGVSLYEGVYDVDYCASLSSAHDLFGCVGLRRKQHCILNTQYSPADYVRLRTKLIQHMIETGEWGEFFPSTISPFPYNDSVAHDFFPLSEAQAVSRGLAWGRNAEDVRGASISTDNLPHLSSDADESVCGQTFGCAECGKGFRIQKTELHLLQQLMVPLPRVCFDCRNKRRMQQVGSIYSAERSCSGCNTMVETCVVPEISEKVLCEVCYLAHIA